MTPLPPWLRVCRVDGARGTRPSCWVRLLRVYRSLVFFEQVCWGPDNRDLGTNPTNPQSREGKNGKFVPTAQDPK